jgi:hypothetical protein
VVVAATGQYTSETQNAGTGAASGQGGKPSAGHIAPQLVDGGPSYQVPLGGGLIAAKVVPWAGAQDILAYLEHQEQASAVETLPN